MEFSVPADEAESLRDQPNWWHRDHPVFTPLTGFFSGLLFVLVVPGVYAGVLGTFLPPHQVRAAFPWILLSLIVPAYLLARGHTRRFGGYFLLGMIATAIVVLGVGALVLWLMVKLDA